MSHIALYRAWRPQRFQDLVGQEHVTTTLQNALREGRFTHAYLFSGPRGTGKTSAAKLLAKAVNCEKGPAAEPCNECSACKRITEGSVMDVIELDAASNNGVDEIRDIRDKVKYAPTEVRRKVYIIDEVHMLSIGASNALLKTLEEPPPHVMFILATTEPHKLPVTIISRCQRYDFRRISPQVQQDRLAQICREEGWDVEERALSHIARLSDGGMRDALSLLDQIVSFCGTTISYVQVMAVTGGIPAEQFRTLATAMKARDIGVCLETIDAMMAEGKSAERCVDNLMQYFRDMLMARMMPAASELRQSADPELARLAEEFDREWIFRTLDILNRYQSEMKFASHPQMLFELAVMRICTQDEEEPRAAASSAAPSADVAALLRKVEGLEREVAELKQRPAAASSEKGRQAAPIPRSPRSLPGQNGAFDARAKQRLAPFVGGRESKAFRDVLMKWSQVLQRVKERKITVHAWLVDGEPVSAAGDSVLVAFKNTIHRETTEKNANKELIEQVIEELCGIGLRLETVMLKDWNDILAENPAAGQPAEELQLTPEDETAAGKEEWIDEAIQLFGEDLVEILDDE